MNNDYAEILGLAFGDGSLINTNRKYMRFQLRGDISEDREHYDTHIIPLFNRAIMGPLMDRHVSVVESKKKNKSYGIAIESNIVGKFLQDLGVPLGKKNELYIPEWLFQEESYQLSFIRGLFDTDGTIYCQKNYSIKHPKHHTELRLRIATTSRVLAEKVCLILTKFNFKVQNKYQKSKKTKLKDAYYIEIAGSIQLAKWFDLISSKNPKHITKYEVWKKFGFCPPKTSLVQRRKLLDGELDIHIFYKLPKVDHAHRAGVPEWSNGLTHDKWGLSLRC